MPTILIVDDQPEIADLLALLLRRAGYDVATAADTTAAWARLGRGVDCVLLDVSMPGENGPELLRRMQLDPLLAEIPVVFVTAHDDPSTRIQCLAMGARGFLAKPVRGTVLVDTVRAVLAGDATEADDPLAAALDAGLSRDATAPGAGEQDVATLVRRMLAERRVLRQQLASHTRLVSALARLTQMVGAGYPLERVGQGVVQLAQTVLGADAAVLWFAGATTLRPLAASDAVPEGPTPPEVVDAFGRRTVERAEGAHVVLHVPLAVAGTPIGVLVARVADAARPSAGLLAFFCAEAALALDASLRLTQAETEAVTDPLTGVHNRRYLDRRLPEEVRRATALGVPLAVLFLDIDRFKSVNDRFGHDRGDAVLRAVAEAVRQTVRGVDVVARYGGEEFVVLLPEADREAACRVAERIRGAVAARGPGVLPEQALSVTVGVAAMPEDGHDAGWLLATADAAMLRGKRSGRDRIVTAEVAVPPRPDHDDGAPAALRAYLAALAVRDPATERHSVAVAALAARVARRMGLDRADVRDVARVGLLHDVGKLFTPDEVLLKPGPLDAAERAVMDRHVPQGAAVVAATAPLRHLADAVAASQEHFDGTGYPEGRAGRAIPLAARIVAAADAWHAIVSDRPYRAARPVAVAAAEMQRCAGTQFDPDVVAALLDVMGLGEPVGQRAAS